MKLLKTDDNGQLTVSMSIDEVRALSGINLEILKGSLQIPDAEWDSALLPVTKDEARVILDDLLTIARTQG